MGYPPPAAPPPAGYTAAPPGYYPGYPPPPPGYYPGYPPPPPGHYPGYPPPPAGTPGYVPAPSVPRRPASSSDIALWARLSTVLVWGGSLVLGIIFPPFFVLSLCAFIPPIIFRSKWPGDALVRHHATQSLNTALTDLVISFGILVLAIVIGSFSLIGLVAMIPVYLAAVALSITRIVYEIMGSVKANNGQFFPLPLWLAFRFAKDDVIASAPPPGEAS